MEDSRTTAEKQRGGQSASDSLCAFVKPGHRADIQGLRAVAVLLVALEHAGVGVLKGGFIGVDVFFVLSGFLITQLLLSEAIESGSVSIANFYMRRARRILPAAALTLVTTDIAAFLLLNFVRAKQTMSDSIWAGLFGANVNFSRQATDYFARGRPASPVLHYWSLSIEEQFYFVWPTVLSLVLVGVLIRRFTRGKWPLNRRSLLALSLVVGLASVVSFVWSAHETGVAPNAAYFSSFARAWELGLGALLATCVPLVRHAPCWFSVALGWAGIACIAVAAVTFSASTPFPGFAALLPTVGAAAVISSGAARAASRLSVANVLSVRPMTYVGDRSYTLYLWHWPFLIIAQDRGLTSMTSRLSLLGAAFVLSCATFRFYENPLRRMKWSRTGGALLWPASAAAVLATALIFTGVINNRIANTPVARAAPQPAISVASRPLHKTPAALPVIVAAVKAADRGAKIPTTLVPPLASLENDYYTYPDPTCDAHSGQTSSKICEIDGTDSLVTTPANPAKKLLLFGDSHADMWMPAIIAMAKQDGWTIIPFTKSGCTTLFLFTRTGPANEAGIRSECRAWLNWAIPHAQAVHAAVALIGMGYSGITGTAGTNSVNGIVSVAERLKKTAKHVVVMADTPYLNLYPEPADCLLSSGATMTTCTGQWSAQDLSLTDAIAAFGALQHFSMIDTTGWFCYRYECPMVAGNTIVYRDYGHVTQTYGTELAPTFRTAFLRATG